jgi:hypothetical protein
MAITEEKPPAMMRWWHWLMLVAAVVAGLAGMRYTRSDPRPDAGVQIAQLQAMMGDAKEVYFEDAGGASGRMFWFVLRRPQYWSCLQGTGVMFYEQTSAEYQRRGIALRELNTQDFGPTLCMRKTNPDEIGPRAIWQIIETCQRLPDLDMMWLLTKVPDYDPPSWKAPAYQLQYDPQTQTVEKVDTWYQYDCRKLR